MPLFTPGSYADDIRDRTFTSEVQHTKLIYRDLEDELQDFFRSVPPVPEHHNVYSTRLWGVILRACAETDSQLAKLTKEIGASPTQPKITDYRRLEGQLQLSQFELASRFDKLALRPFLDFAENKTPGWWLDYNAIKHRRLETLKSATVLNAMNAVAGLYIVLLRQWGEYLFPRRMILLSGTHIAEAGSEMFSVMKAPWS